MNFDNIKDKMNAENMDENDIPSSIKTLKASLLPMQQIKKRMILEMILQLLAILFLSVCPLFVQVYALPLSVFYVSVFVSAVITVGYLIKMFLFLKQTNNFALKSKDMLVEYINKFNCTLEVYKTALLSAYLLMPIALLAFILGSHHFDESVFTNLFMFKVSGMTLFLYVAGYLTLSASAFFKTIWRTNKIFGAPISKLESILEQFNENN